MKNELDHPRQKANDHHWKQRRNENEVSGHGEGHAYSWCETSFPVHDWSPSVSCRGTKNQGSVLNTLIFLFLPTVAVWFKLIDMSDIKGSCSALYQLKYSRWLSFKSPLILDRKKIKAIRSITHKWSLCVCPTDRLVNCI